MNRDYHDEYSHVVEFIQEHYENGSRVPDKKELITRMRTSYEVCMIAAPSSPHSSSYGWQAAFHEVLADEGLLLEALKDVPDGFIGAMVKEGAWWFLDMAIRVYLLPGLIDDAIDLLVDIGWLRQ